MVRPWFCAETKESEGVELVGFFRGLAAAMGCFFSCFRIKDSHSHLMSAPEPMISRNENTLSSLFLSDEVSLRKGGDQNPLPEEVNDMELKDEVKFLKACGTLLDTPVEIRKAFAKCVNTSTQKDESPNLNSPNASNEKLKPDKQPDESPTPVQSCEEWVTGSGSLLDSSSSCMTDGHNTRRDSFNSIQSIDTQNVLTPSDVPDNGIHSSPVSFVSPVEFATSVQCKTKSVRFECQSERSTFSSEISSQYSKQSGSSDNFSVSKPSPYPTPLKLTDEMQTPGTAFPAYLNDMPGGKPNRIRSQYVYSVLNPIEYPSQWKEFKEGNFDPNHLRESLKPNDEDTLLSSPISGSLIEEISCGKDKNDEASLSYWLKPCLANQDGNNEQFDSISDENVHCGRTPGDRPILGMVVAHWNDDEASHISPKWWDGNGIPNSTNKYKEDQKVSWHATPFEERLEKALSGDTFVYQRKPISRTPPVEFNEIEEYDTASSELQSSAHLKSIVSF